MFICTGRSAPAANARRLFLDYLREINSLAEKPEFYNALTTNCTTSILTHTRVNQGGSTSVVESATQRLYSSISL